MQKRFLFVDFLRSYDVYVPDLGITQLTMKPQLKVAGAQYHSHANHRRLHGCGLLPGHEPGHVAEVPERSCIAVGLKVCE